MPVTLRSAPVELFSVTAPAAALEAVWPTLVAIVAAPAVMATVFTPLARSIADKRSATVAAGVPAVPR
ncbi:sorbitol-specific phosphotransferase system component IIBC [Bradyrhizobium sp. F1.13.4]